LLFVLFHHCVGAPLADSRFRRLPHTNHRAAIGHSVIPTEAEGSRAVCGAQGRIRGPMKRRRICKDLRMRLEDGARSLDYSG
jgi:hypothetical protein